MEAASISSAQEAFELKSSFTEFKRFEGDNEQRQPQRDRFMQGEIWAPQYEYPELVSLYDFIDEDDREYPNDPDTFIKDKKSKIQEAIIVLEAAKGSGEYSEAKIELQLAFHENRLKRVLLAEAARRLHTAGSSAALEVARAEYMALNEALFGEFDRHTFLGMLTTEKNRVEQFIPDTPVAQDIKEFLSGYFANRELDVEEEPLLSEELMFELREVIKDREEEILAVVPDTADDRYYDADEAVDIFNKMLEAGGLAQKGWKAKKEPKKSIPNTSTLKQLIQIPGNFRRTAAEIRRLGVHEQEVHARRGQNGLDSGEPMLVDGTADYADVEEGLGVLKECILEGSMDNPSFHRARERYITAGLLFGAEDGIPLDGKRAYEVLWRMLAVRDNPDGVISDKQVEKAQQRAMTHLDNAFRGTNFAMPGVFYTKLKIYHEGLKKNAIYFEKNRHRLSEALDDATIGKCNHTDEVELEQVKTLVAEASK